MTFLEYVCERLMGPPAHRSADRSTWHCPRHEDSDPSFCTRPPHPKYKERFDCRGCGWWGDVYDFLREFYPGENYPRLRVRTAALRRDWEAEKQLEPEPSVYRGRGHTEAIDPTGEFTAADIADQEFSVETDAALAELMEYLKGWPTPRALREALKIAKVSLEICSRRGLHPLGLAGRCGAEAWKSETDQSHLAECVDGDCESIVCRRSRGWTEERIQVGIDRMREGVNGRRKSEGVGRTTRAPAPENGAPVEPTKPPQKGKRSLP